MQGFIRELALAALLTAALIGGALFLHYADLLTPGR
jgi:hypothetical protein